MKRIYNLIFLLLASYVGYAQSILSVYPNEGRRNETVWLSIEGLNTHFTQSTSLTIVLKSNVDGSEIELNDVFASSDDYMNAPAFIPVTATPGKYALRIITTNEGTLTKANVFTVTNLPPVPELMSVTPGTGNNGEHVRLTLYARYAKFLAASYLDVYVSGSNTYISADSIVALNDTMVSAFIHIPAKSRTDMCAVIVYADNDAMYLDACFNINGIDPEIVEVTPDSASNGTHVDVTIRTTKTTFMSSSFLDVRLRSGWTYIDATSATAINDSVLVASFDIPQRTRSSVCDVTIYDEGFEITKMEGFTINGIEPELTYMDPVEGVQGQTLDVTITGKDMFFTSASSVNVTLYSIGSGGFMQGTSVVVLNDNQIKTTLKLTNSTTIGDYVVSVDVDWESFDMEEFFTVIDDGIPDPRLVSITPDEVTRGKVLEVTITGERTRFTQGSPIRVVLSGNGFYEGWSLTALNDSILKCYFSFPLSAPVGVYSLYVVDENDNGNDYMLLEDAFTIKSDPTTEPKLLSISPAMTFPGQTLDVTITGARTHFMASSTTVELYIFSQATQVAARSFTATSNTSMNARFDIPDDFPLGVYDFGVSTSEDGWITLLQSVIVNAVGLNEAEKLAIKLYPNPVTDKLYLETPIQVNTVTVLDITGREIPVDKNDIVQQGDQYTIPLDRLGLKKGIYFIRITSDSGSGYQKFILE